MHVYTVDVLLTLAISMFMFLSNFDTCLLLFLKGNVIEPVNYDWILTRWNGRVLINVT